MTSWHWKKLSLETCLHCDCVIVFTYMNFFVDMPDSELLLGFFER